MDQDQGFKPQQPEQAPRLGIVHLLGWMAGCAVVLAIYRGTTDWAKIDPEYRATLRLWQLAFGLLYGTALSGLGLLAWRRLRGQSTFPTMPGHWLLVLSGIGFLHDGLTSWIAGRILAHESLSPYGFSPYWLQQTLGWGGAALVGLGCCFVKGAPFHWRVFILLVTLVFFANALTHGLGAADQLSPLVLRRRLFSGSWPYYYGPLARVVGETTCVGMLPLLVWLDARARLRRDWLHWTGAVVVTGLAIVDVLQNFLTLRQF